MKIIRQMETSNGLSIHDDALEISRGRNRVFYSAVVVEFVSNPDEYLELQAKNEDDGILNRESLKSGKQRVSNSNLVDKMPRNSIIGIIVSGKASRGVNTQIIYPFFSQHMSSPVKPGEQVWVVFEHAGKKGSLGYWLTRKATDLQVDDLNYTHQDRITLGLDREEAPDESDFNPNSFPLGGKRSKESNTLLGNNPYTEIIENSDAYQNQYTGEPVPRFSKRAGDYVLQGSNNTLIVLGEDRDGSLATDISLKGKGTIDIVAGRGVLLAEDTIFDIDSDGTTRIDNDESTTAPTGISKNTREYFEIDKTPKLTSTEADAKSNIAEGDPDYINDLSRLFISMKANGDKKFGIDTESEALPTAFESEIEDVDEDAYIVFKSNQIRIIARKNEDHDINGSIRIIKEGDKGEDLAAIIMLPDGTIQISGNKVFIGRTKDDGGIGSDESDGGDADPYMRFSEFKAYMNDTLDAVDTKINSLATKVQNFANSITSGGTTPGYGAPNIPFISPSITLSNDATTLQNEQDVKAQKNDTMDNIKSERIFGE